MTWSPLPRTNRGPDQDTSSLAFWVGMAEVTAPFFLEQLFQMDQLLRRSKPRARRIETDPARQVWARIGPVVPGANLVHQRRHLPAPPTR
jgi:hypothetical protein